MYYLEYGWEVFGGILLLIFIGFLMRKRSGADDRFVDQACRLLFYTGYPAVVFIRIYEADVFFYSGGAFFWYAATALVIVNFFIVLLVPRLMQKRESCGAYMHCLAGGTSLLPSVAAAGYLMGEETAAQASLLFGLLLPIILFLGVIYLSVYADEKRGGNGLRILGRILLNPIFIAVVLALIFSAGGYQLPGPLEDGVNWLADMVMGLSFLLLGMQLGSRGRFAAGPVFSGALMKTVGIPAAVLTPALLFFDFAPSEVGALLTVFAAPTSVLSLIMTKSMNSNGNLAGELSAATLVLSLITMVLGTLVLGWLGYV